MSNLLTPYTGRNRACGVLVLLALAAAPALAQDRVLRGVVVERETGIRLPGAVLSIGGRTARTDSRGRFALRGLRAVTSVLVASRVGFIPDTLRIGATTDSIRIELSRSPVVLDPVTVEGLAPELERFFNETQSSSVSLQPSEIRRTPVLLEADVLRTVQLLPGTVTKNDYSVGFNVRGGEADQNLILLDGATVFNPSHLGGLFSTFDAAAVSGVDFTAGGFPARYPGRLSSVVDIGIRNGNPRETEVTGQLSLLTSKLLVEGPLGGGASYLIGGRRTYADAVVGAFTTSALPYYFSDAIGKVTLPLGSGGGLFTATAYWGRDDLGLDLVDSGTEEEDVNLEFDWGNRLVSLNAAVPIRNSFLQSHLSISEFSTTLGLLPSLARYDNSARVIRGEARYSLHNADDHTVEFGASVEAFEMDYRLGSPGLEVVLVDQGYDPTVFSAFVDDEIRVSSRLLLRPGARVNWIPEAEFEGISPRVSFKAFLDGRTALTGSLGRYHQPIHSIRDQEQPITIFEFWIGADSVVPVARSDQAVLGVERWFGDGHRLSIEGYTKYYENLVIPNREQDFNVIGDEFNRTSGSSWGLDLLFRRYVGAVKGWISYSFARTRRESDGAEFPPGHDRTHTVNVVLQAPGPLGSDMSVRWGYGSPLPFTGFRGEWNHRRYSPGSNIFFETVREPIGSGLNGERYPHYSRLDIGFRWETRALGGVLNPYLNFVNLYNRRNVFIYFFDFSDSPVTRTGISQLPLVPTFGVEFRW